MTLHTPWGDFSASYFDALLLYCAAVTLAALVAGLATDVKVNR